MYTEVSSFQGVGIVYTEVSSFQGVGIVYTEVSSFQGVGIEEVLLYTDANKVMIIIFSDYNNTFFKNLDDDFPTPTPLV